ncbi:hypothetical protein JYT74_01745 [Crocinitomix catalasitica]|nr:hypothetical protein [Crocinitomix catalasitica]
MPRVLTIVLLMVFSSLYAQREINNRLINFRLGYTIEQLFHKSLIDDINDTSTKKFDLVTQMPSISYAHEFILGNVLSIGGTVGFQYMNVFYGAKHFGSTYFFASVDPRVSIFTRLRFEYYMKLHIGATIWTHDISQLNDRGQRLFPGRANFFTGVTLGGFNFFLNERWGINIELSIWSPELAAIGLTYRFYRGKLPKIQGDEDDEKGKSP